MVREVTFWVSDSSSWTCAVLVHTFIKEEEGELAKSRTQLDKAMFDYRSQWSVEYCFMGSVEAHAETCRMP